ncbi:hypothetical protein TGDOM2_320280 [Toxoplasma gondii GAB2-2007-GAL-DOM2]|uniref:Uncharacterized protein n=4 Tax=Toxoplasma gondii TaxID=5811 RepID=B9QIE1_TOXGV|nr:hypothetical protein TGVEG_320280 [Toxoplasma gondii VEG]KFG32606.1 hypothetical protein TGDOM2_320280 [Toxoplasma gondii GAB2-2007-GAL-DOM2]KFG43898.1 hypothetical protein TGP89_320280 [Toxoplasma gondii p89]PUA88558.1 hypothetical protein TGBR9_320280 [Toxoplasma gondii TgCATBr9]
MMQTARGNRNIFSHLWQGPDALQRNRVFKKTLVVYVAFAAVSSLNRSSGYIGGSIAIWESHAAGAGSSVSLEKPERPVTRGGLLPSAYADDVNYDAGQLDDSNNEGVVNHSEFPKRDGEENDTIYAGSNGVLPATSDEEKDDNEQFKRPPMTRADRQGGSIPHEGDVQEGEVTENADYSPDTEDEDELAIEGDDDGEETEHEEFDFQYYLPHQYRRVIPGTNIDYYDYVLMEERQARGEVNEPPNDRSGLLPSDDGKALPVVTANNGVFSYCYTTEKADILERCAQAATLGDGVYIPIVNMTDFGRHNNAELGNPAVQTVSIPPQHYTLARQDLPPEWFETIAELKNRTHLRVGGLWFGPPDFDRMSAVLREYPGLLDGFLVDWDSGEGACMSKIKRPPRFSRNGRQNGWWNPKSFFMRYYTGGQDVDVCRLPDRTPYTAEPFVNNNFRGKCFSVEQFDFIEKRDW